MSQGAGAMKSSDCAAGPSTSRSVFGAGLNPSQEGFSSSSNSPELFDPTDEASSDDKLPEETNVFVRFYRNGFTIDYGPLRSYDDPENKGCLEAFDQDIVPPELGITGPGRVVLNKIDHRSEDHPSVTLYIQPRSLEKVHRPTPAPIPASSDPVINETRAIKMLNFNWFAPSTVVKVKLPDESRLVIDLNYHHTIGDVRQYIVTARPEYSGSIFELHSSYPQRVLRDYDATVGDEDLCEGVVIMKIK